MTEPQSRRPDDIPPEVWEGSTAGQVEKLRMEMHELAHVIIAESPRWLRPLVRWYLLHPKEAK